MRLVRGGGDTFNSLEFETVFLSWKIKFVTLCWANFFKKHCFWASIKFPITIKCTINDEFFFRFAMKCDVFDDVLVSFVMSINSVQN